MKKIRTILALLLMGTSGVSAQQHAGSLVIVGGALEANNKSVYSQLIELAGGVAKASFAVIPAASGVSAQSWVSFSKILISYGVKRNNIHLIKIALLDDDSTKDVDESLWKNNGNDTHLADIVRNCSAVWFTGGDQLRIMKALVLSDGSQTPVLKAVWEVYEKGGVIGGSSAGAAIMSKVMIGNGNSFGALSRPISYDTNDTAENGTLLLTTGLGFFPHGIVDQHFHAKGRIGRLAVALMTSIDRFSIAFGVDENTAMIYTAKENSIKVAGTSGVTILDGSVAEMKHIDNYVRVNNMAVIYLEEGDRFDFNSKTLIPAAGKKPTKGKEYYDHKTMAGSGILAGENPSFRDLVTAELIDNKGADTVSNISLDNEKSGFILTFSKKPESRGYYSDNGSEVGSYAVSDIRMDITPVNVSITPITETNTK